jgi:hypothetical protein
LARPGGDHGQGHQQRSAVLLLASVRHWNGLRGRESAHLMKAAVGRRRYRGSGERAACKMGLEGIVSKRLGSRYRSGRTPDWLKFKNPEAPAVKREAEEEWGQ